MSTGKMKILIDFKRKKTRMEESYMSIIKINHENVFFWSDMHIHHDRPFIIEPRGFSSVKEHDDTLFERFNTKVNKDATVFLLGDTMFGKDAQFEFIRLLKDLNYADIFVMPGNHYSGFHQAKRDFGRTFELTGGKTVTLISNLEEVTVNGQMIVMSHYPLLSWNQMGKGAWMIHGHTHGRIAQTRLDGAGFGKILDVGVESVTSPISIGELRTVMEGKPFSHIDHH